MGTAQDIQMSSTATGYLLPVELKLFYSELGEFGLSGFRENMPNANKPYA